MDLLRSLANFVDPHPDECDDKQDAYIPKNHSRNRQSSSLQPPRALPDLKKRDMSEDDRNDGKGKNDKQNSADQAKDRFAAGLWRKPERNLGIDRNNTGPGLRVAPASRAVAFAF